MKAISKIFCAVIAVVLVFGLIACSKTDDDAVATPTARPATPTPTNPDVEENVDEPYEAPSVRYFGKFDAVDLGGREILYVPGWVFNMQSDQEPPDPSQPGFNPEQLRIYDNMLRVADKYNASIMMGWNWDYWNFPDQIINGYLAHEPVADLVAMITFHPLQTASAGVLHFLKDVAPADSDLWNEKIIIEPSTHPILKDYAWYWNALNRGKDVEGVYYNRDMISSLGLEDPKDLYNQGRWNLDVLFEYMNTATRVNPDDTYASYGWGTNWLSTNRMIMQAHNTWEFVVDAGGHYIAPYTTPDFVAALEMTMRIFIGDAVAHLDQHDGLDESYYGTTQDAWKRGNVLFWILGIRQMPTGEDRMTFDYGIVPMPRKAGDNSHIRHYPQDITLAIPIGVENPKAVFSLFEELMAYNIDDQEEALEDQMDGLRRFFNHEEDVEMAMEINLHLNRSQTILRHDYNWEQLVWAVCSGTETISEATESRLGPAQDLISELLHFDMGIFQ
ncbi:MAG: hypothetical protein FWE82_03150 [Defluviitaleaceae bacterium]|nr:hypothetical protein [Defluviitaleaceae bacterium]